MYRSASIGIYILLVLCWLSGGGGSPLRAQPGVKVIYTRQSTPSWEAAASEYFRTDVSLLRDYIGGGVYYWLENRRYNLAVNPGIYLLQSRTTQSGRDTLFDYSDRVFGLGVDVSFYPFNPIKLNAWLDTPPMGGRKSQWKKSLFLQVTPAVAVHGKRIDPSGEAHTGVNFKVDIGAGMQFNLFRHVGVAPIVKLGIQPGMKWTGIGEIHEASNISERTSGTYLSTALYFFYY